MLSSCRTLGGNQPPNNLVTDWRDEVVYQLMVDRFANSDLTNDFNVDLTNHGEPITAAIGKVSSIISTTSNSSA